MELRNKALKNALCDKLIIPDGKTQQAHLGKRQRTWSRGRNKSKVSSGKAF